jgi:hypothetical protein
VGIKEQAEHAGTPLARFLDERLPDRDHLVQTWLHELASDDHEVPGRGGRDSVGWACELRLSLDLNSEPPRLDELSYLPVERCTEVLEAVGFEHRGLGVLPMSATTDPVLRRWARTHHPIATDAREGRVLAACLDLAGFRQPMHRWKGSRTVEERRALLASMSQDGNTLGNDAGLLDMLVRCWSTYLHHGRRRLLELGSHVIASPELGHGFGVADLVIGSTLIDVKLAVEPTAEDVVVWLRQLLGYVLLDRYDIFAVDTVGVYCGWSGHLLTYPIPALIAHASPGAPTTLERLRDEFRTALHEDLDGYVAWRERSRYSGHRR